MLLHGRIVEGFNDLVSRLKTRQSHLDLIFVQLDVAALDLSGCDDFFDGVGQLTTQSPVHLIGADNYDSRLTGRL